MQGRFQPTVDPAAKIVVGGQWHGIVDKSSHYCDHLEDDDVSDEFQNVCDILFQYEKDLLQHAKDVPSFKHCRDSCESNKECAGFSFVKSGTDKGCWTFRWTNTPSIVKDNYNYYLKKNMPLNIFSTIMDINSHGGRLSSLVDSLASDCPSDMDTVCRRPEFKDRMKTFLSKAKTLDGADCKDQSTCRMYQNRALQEFEEIVLSPILFSNCPQGSDLCKTLMHFKSHHRNWYAWLCLVTSKWSAYKTICTHARGCLRVSKVVQYFRKGHDKSHVEGCTFF